MTTFLDFIRKVHEERKQWEYVIKGGKGSGWYGPPKGTHTTGAKAGAKTLRPFEAIKMYKGWKDSLSPEESRALSDYTAGKWALVNGVLRGITDEEQLSDISAKKYQEITKGLDSSLGRARVPEDTMAYRKLGKTDVSDWQSGFEFRDDGFVSTSLDTAYIEKHFDGPLARIKVPKGTKGAFLSFPDADLGDVEESELLLNRGLSFRVVTKKNDVIDLEVVG